MLLIRKLDTKFIGGFWRRCGIFLCPFCNLEVERVLENGKRQKSCGCVKNELISEARKGIKQSEEHNQKISETRIKNGLAKGEKNPFYGKKHTEKTRQKMIEKHIDFSGQNNPNWQNGKSFEIYPQEFKQIRKFILDRDNHTCQNPNCKHISERLDIHHIDYDKKNNSLENLITLCINCHMKTNYNREYWTEFYKNRNI